MVSGSNARDEALVFGSCIMYLRESSETSITVSKQMLVKEDYRSGSGLFEADKTFLLVFLPSCLANASPDANARPVVLLPSCLANASLTVITSSSCAH